LLETNIHLSQQKKKFTLLHISRTSGMNGRNHLKKHFTSIAKNEKMATIAG